MDLGVTVLDWPADSPDLNCIENVWSILEDHINKRYSDLRGQGASQQARKAFHQAIQKSWKALDQRVINNCINSVKKRVRAVILAKGWYTKY